MSEGKEEDTVLHVHSEEAGSGEGLRNGASTGEVEMSPITREPGTEAEKRALLRGGKEQEEEQAVKVVEEEERGTWGNRIQFLLSCIGYSVGIGNIWRFPYLVYEYGGGSFLIPYFTCLFVLGIPLYMLDLVLGQVLRKSALHTVRAIHWRLTGIGLASAVLSTLVGLYYNVVISWAFVYLIHSFQSPLPWTGHAQSYFLNDILHVSSGAQDTTKLIWPLVGALAATWIIMYFIIWKGIGMSGKIVYFTATFPYVLLIALFGISITREGAGEGIKYYLTPQWEKVWNLETWATAANQIFFSLGIGFGSLITYASFNKKEENVVFDGFLIPILNSATSFFAGFVIFGMLGHLAHRTGTSVDKVVEGGIGLAFIAYPDSMAMLPNGLAQVTSVAFFFMLFLLGVDSQLGMVEVTTNILEDAKIPLRKEYICLIVCAFGFCGGLLFVSNSGYYWVKGMDTYAGIFGLFVVAASLVMATVFIYGSKRLSDTINEWTGRPIPWFIRKISWAVTSWVLLLLLLGYAFVNMVRNGISPSICSLGGTQACGAGIQAVMWMIALFSPAVALFFTSGAYLKPKTVLDASDLRET